MDYDKLAKKHGGSVVEETPTNDFDVLAAQYGGQEVAQPVGLAKRAGRGLVEFGKAAGQAIASPVLNLLARPGQAVQHLLGDERPIEGKFLGVDITDPYADVSRGASPMRTVLQDVGRGIETVATGVTGGMTKSLGAFKGAAALGGISGAGASLAAGETDPAVIAKDTILSSLFGGVTGAAASRVGKARALGRETAVNMKDAEFIREAGAKEVAEYMNLATESTKSHRNPVTWSRFSRKADEAAEGVSKAMREAGKQVGETLEKVKDVVLEVNPETRQPFSQEFISSFAESVEKRFGQKFATAVEAWESGKFKNLDEFLKEANTFIGEGTELLAAEGRDLRKISKADGKKLIEVFEQLRELSKNPTVQRTKDVMANLDEMVDWKKVDKFGVVRDPLDPLFQSLRGQMNAAIRVASPELAEANARFSQLKRFEKMLAKEMGPDLSRAKLAARRAFAGDKSDEVKEVMEGIKELTGIDLQREAGLARFAAKGFGDESSLTLFSQAMGAIPDVKSEIVGRARKLLTQQPDKGTMALEIAKGRTFRGGKLGKMFDDAVEMFTPQLRAMGVKSENVLDAAKALARMYVINRAGEGPQALKIQPEE